MIIKAQGAAQFAEEYLIKSIWNNHFPPGSILPSERELSEKIGVTRTTLREVLQRLARDGWLNIQHGKPTRVNDIWTTASLNILETVARMDNETKAIPLYPHLIDDLLAARTNISVIFISRAFSKNPEQSKQLLTLEEPVNQDAKAFTDLDYDIFRGLAFASGNPIYGLILNGLRGLYTRIGGYYFSNPEAKELALQFYAHLRKILSENSTNYYEKIAHCVRVYGKKSGDIWLSMKNAMPDEIVNNANE